MDIRTPDQICKHYEIEKLIADKLRRSSAVERKTLYATSYDELFRRLPHHPMLAIEAEKTKTGRIGKDIANLASFLTPETVYVEIGPGDCSLAIEIAKSVKQVYAIDVSTEITKGLTPSDNFELILSDGTSIPVPDASVDIVFSNQLMEHLHPDDAMLQLSNIYRSLKSGGVYFCITPNRLSGPHDISRNFDPVAKGLHLREYNITELSRIFKKIGFRKSWIFLRFMNTRLFLPVFPYLFVEKILDAFPHGFRKLITFNKVIRFLLGVKIVAGK